MKNSTYDGEMAARSQELEPLAIIGLGCRFPGSANTWRDYWRLLESGTDAIAETPSERWNLDKFYARETTPGKTQSRWGGYVDAIDQFDPQLFGISPREAASMDPQQRMLLEVAFRAVEDAGTPIQDLAGSSVAVFTGISSFDYAVAGLSYQDRGVINPYSNTGGSSSIAANRISYCFDLRGPSVAVDTACSSSLVAVHMACEAIWRGDAQLALAGGVNALIMPDFYVAFSQLGVLSPDGRCKTFDKRANGYVRSEGAGMVMLKPLSAALRDKDPIYATIRATALNQDGRTQGMTVPSQDAQERLLKTALHKARIKPADIQYVEAHGTGTPVGDPIEARALGSVLGQGREGNCQIASVKTNIGHLEAGAGIASLIKVALSLHHRRIPAHLHFQDANPDIDFESLKLQVPTQTTEWNSEVSRLAGINGFGYGGANAHVILEEAPDQARSHFSSVHSAGSAASPKASSSEPAPAASARPVLIPISAENRAGLAQIAGDLASWIETNPEVHLGELAGYIAHRRSHFGCRATVCATSREDMLSELRTLAASQADEFAEDFGVAKIAKGPVFVCSGQGPQWWAMGRGLLKYSPAFRSVIKRCDTEFAKYGNWSLLEELTRSEATSRMQKTSIAQPSIFAIQVALAAVWKSWGIQPAAIVGHSVGEIAAAYLSGALTWKDACRVAFHRGRTMDLATSEGAMVAAGLAPEEVPQWIEGMESEVGIAAINGPTSVTISGEKQSIEQLATKLEEAGVFCRRLAVEYAFHSPQMEPVREELLQSLDGIEPRKPHTRLISTVSGEPVDGPEMDANYWWLNVRQAVRFSDATRHLAEQGFGVAVEIGPHPVLAYAINECFQTAGKSVRSVASLNRQQDDLTCITKSLGSLYSLGFDIEWQGFYNQPQRKLDIPLYPFQLQRCWCESQESRSTRLAAPVHPLLGEASDSPKPEWQNRLDLKIQDYLADHCIREGSVYPAAAIVETAFKVSTEILERTEVKLERVQILNACSLSESRPQWLRSTYDQDRRELKIAYRDCNEDQWTALGSVGISADLPTATTYDPGNFVADMDAVRSRCTEDIDRQRLYEYCAHMGLSYGKQFQGMQSGWRRDGEALCEVALPNLEPSNGYLFHPALLDSCFHAMIAADSRFDSLIEGLYLPQEIERLELFRPPTDKLLVHARMLSKTTRQMLFDLDIFDEYGNLIAAVRKFRSQRVTSVANETSEDLLYSYAWEAQPLADEHMLEPGEPQRWLLFMDENKLGREIGARLRATGDQVAEVYRADSDVAQANAEFFQVDPENKSSFVELFAELHESGFGAPDQVIYFWGLDTPSGDKINQQNLEQSTRLTSLAPLHLVQAWDQQVDAPNAELSIVTQSAQSWDEQIESTAIAQGPLIGFGRVIASEYATLRTKLIDLPPSSAPSDIDCLFRELHARDEEDEVLWRDGTRFAHRFNPQKGRSLTPDAVGHFDSQLSIGASAGIEELHYATKPQPPLQKTEVEIEVIATGLNFSDVMKALDLYPGLPDGPVQLGAECCGRIRRVGAESKWKVGDEVIAVAHGAFATSVVVDQELVAPKPRNLSHEEAACLPIAFLTAEYALSECARLREGDSVLIHSASGGVGLAAMQLAKRLGANILATAGNEEKRQYVRDRGASHVMDSRSLAFAEQTLEATAGEGVDAVLNSLPGEAIPKGISTLKTGGRFLEIGKRDIYNDASLKLYPFRNNLAMFAIDLDQLFKQQQSRMGTMLRRLVPLFESGELQPLPVTPFGVNDTKAAFRFMQQGKHIGKVAVRYNQHPSEVVVGELEPLRFPAEATFWVPGVSEDSV